MKKVGIIGFGVVGKAMYTLFPEAVVYDKYAPLKLTWYSEVTQSQQARDLTLKDVNDSCDVAFVCVPTPLKDGYLDISAVEEVVAACTCPLIVIRSTLNPGDTDRLAKQYEKRLVFQPEYMGETVQHPLTDQQSRPFLILGGSLADTREVIELYQSVYSANLSIRQTDPKTAEVIKLSENRAIAFKVAQAQELFDACEAGGVDYYTVREAVYGDDPRFNRWFTFIYPEARGMNSKCIPKDVYAWGNWASSLNEKAGSLTLGLLAYNDTLINKDEEAA